LSVSPNLPPPRPDELIALARARRSLELGRLPGWGATLTPAMWQRLRAEMANVSSGTLVAVLRHATRQRQMGIARDLFLLLLQRIEPGTQFWAREAAWRMVGSTPEQANLLREDLMQDLTLRLWDELALRSGEGWELFFRRSLAHAQSRVASHALERHGYSPGSRLALLVSDLAAHSLVASEPRDPFDAADLADLRAHVERLPPRERAAVVMRHWQHAREREIAMALGVTPRTVRNLLRRAYGQLAALYNGSESGSEPGGVE
jgi:RNA polymerase sigma factor (sigma-70 family)